MMPVKGSRAGYVSCAVGQAMRKARKKAGLSICAMSKASRTSMCHVSEVERGIHGLSVEALYRFAAALGIHPSKLLPEPIK